MIVTTIAGVVVISSRLVYDRSWRRDTYDGGQWRGSRVVVWQQVVLLIDIYGFTAREGGCIQASEKATLPQTLYLSLNTLLTYTSLKRRSSFAVLLTTQRHLEILFVFRP